MFKIQQTWRTISSTPFGWYVWEVLEYMPSEKETVFPTYLTPCVDGTHIYVTCSHFFTEEQARLIYDEPDYLYQSVCRIDPTLAQQVEAEYYDSLHVHDDACLAGCVNPAMHNERGHDV